MSKLNIKRVVRGLLVIITFFAFIQSGSFSQEQDAQAKAVSTPKVLRGSWYGDGGEAGATKIVVTKHTFSWDTITPNLTVTKWKVVSQIKFYTNTRSKSYHRISISKGKNGYYKLKTSKNNKYFGGESFYLKPSKKNGHKILLRKNFGIDSPLWSNANLMNKYYGKYE